MPAQKLILNKKDLKQNTIALFKEIESDSALKKSFIKNPTGVLSEKVMKTKPEVQEISDSNRLLFSILANQKFIDWLAAYSKKNKNVSKDQYAADFIKAAVKFGDKNIISSISKYLTGNGSIPGLGDVAQQFIINNAAGTALVTPVNQPSTSDQSARSSQNFETSTQSNTRTSGINLGINHLFDPAFMRSTTELLISRAKELSQAGKLKQLNNKIL